MAVYKALVLTFHGRLLRGKKAVGNNLGERGRACAQNLISILTNDMTLGILFSLFEPVLLPKIGLIVPTLQDCED